MRNSFPVATWTTRGRHPSWHMATSHVEGGIGLSAAWHPFENSNPENLHPIFFHQTKRKKKKKKKGKRPEQVGHPSDLLSWTITTKKSFLHLITKQNNKSKLQELLIIQINWEKSVLTVAESKRHRWYSWVQVPCRVSHTLFVHEMPELHRRTPHIYDLNHSKLTSSPRRHIFKFFTLIGDSLTLRCRA